MSLKIFKAITIAVMASMGLFAGTVPTAQAAQLTFDLRIDSVGGGAVITDGPNKTASVNVGSTVTVSLWAVITGANGPITDDGFQAATGSVKSPTSTGLLGNLSANAVFGSGYLASGAGTLADLDADTDTDVGATSTTVATGYANWAFSSAQFTGQGGGPTNTHKLWTATYTVSATPDNSTTQLQFFPRIMTTGAAPFKWVSDGVAHTEYATVSLTNQAANPNVGSGLAITLTHLVPEPASFALLGLGALGMLFVRRRAKA